MLESHGLTVMSLGFALGLRHALDTDHIVAVSTVLAERPSVQASSVIGLFWGLGHTLMLLTVGCAVLVLHVTIPAFLAETFEFFIGLMLVVLGIGLARRLYRERWHAHLHQHGEQRHAHLHRHVARPDHVHSHWLHSARRPLMIGMAHGLAGSAALLLMVVSTAGTVAQGVGYILIFGAGSILGMMAVGMAISVPIVLSFSFSRQAFIAVQGLASLGSIGLGLMMMWRLSFGSQEF